MTCQPYSWRYSQASAHLLKSFCRGGPRASAASGALCRQYGVVNTASSARHRRLGEAVSLPPSPPGIRQRVAGAGAPGMSDPGLHDRAAGGRLAGPVRAISLMLTPVINRVGLTGAAQWRLSPGREMSAQQAGLL